MIADSIRAIIDLLMLRKTEKKLDAEIRKAPVDFQKAELEVERARLEIAKLEREQAPAGIIVTPDRISIDDIHKYDPRAGAVAAQARTLGAFLSYAPTDADLARSLRTTLYQRHGLSAFIQDEGRVYANFSSFADVTRQAIEDADIFIILLSPATIQSYFIRRELEFALAWRKRIVPVYVEGFDLEVLEPEPFNQLRNLSAVQLGATNMEEVAKNIWRLIREK